MRATRTLSLALLLTAVACGRGSDDSSASSADLATGTTLAPALTLAPTKSGPAYSDASGAVIVAGANQYLAAWTELHLATKKSTVALTRIGADGMLLDDHSITLPALSGGDDGTVALAFDGTGYLAVWSHKTGSTSIIRGARIGADGKVTDAQPFTLGRTNGNATTPAVAYTSGGYLVTWSDDRDSGASADSYVNEVYGARISTGGAVVGSAEGFRITNAPGTLDHSLSIAAVGSTFLVGYAKRVGNGFLPQAVRVSDAGTVLDATPLSFGTGGDAAPAIATDGNQFFVAWNEPQRMAGTRVTKDGAKLDGTSIQISSDRPLPAAVAWDGEAFTVAWKNGTQRVGPNGALVGSALPGGPTAIAGTRPAVASVGSSLFVIHYLDADAGRGLPSRISGNVLPKAGGPATKSGLVLARGPALQRNVTTAAHGSSSLSVWLEYEDAAHPKLNGALFANGAATPITIDAGLANTNDAPAVAWDGSAYAVAWQKSAQSSSVVHVDDTGTITDTPKTFTGAHPQLTLGGSGKVLLTTYSATQTNTGWFLDNASAPVVQTSETGVGPTGKPVWDGSRYILAWATTKVAGTAEIHVQRFDKLGAPLDAPAIKLASFPVAAGQLPKVTLASNGLDTLIAFESTNQIVGARLSANGILDVTPVRLDAGTSGFAFEPRLAWDGSQWTLAYERRADANVDEAGYSLELTRIRPGAGSLSVTGPAQALATRGFLPAVAAGASGVTFLGYESLGVDDLAGPRIALTLFTDTTGPVVPPGSSSSSGGTTSPGDDDDGSGPATPTGDDDDDNAPKKPSGAIIAPTKSATIKPAAGSSGKSGDADDAGGCSTSGTSNPSSSSPLLFVALGALLMRRRFVRRAGVPHLRR